MLWIGKIENFKIALFTNYKVVFTVAMGACHIATKIK
jgi:hypothetical protein